MTTHSSSWRDLTLRFENCCKNNPRSCQLLKEPGTCCRSSCEVRESEESPWQSCEGWWLQSRPFLLMYSEYCLKPTLHSPKWVLAEYPIKLNVAICRVKCSYKYWSCWATITERKRPENWIIDSLMNNSIGNWLSSYEFYLMRVLGNIAFSFNIL